MAALGAGVVALRRSAPERPLEPVPEVVDVEKPAVSSAVPQPVREAAVPVEEVADEQAVDVLGDVAVPVADEEPRLSPEEKRRRAREMVYWEQQQTYYERLLERLDQERDPAKRRQLISQISRMIRTDTELALAWAMGLEDEEEQRLAMEGIRKNALVGIGARIEKDETGFPKIRDVMELGAVGATGMVEAGDYLVGMDPGDGTTVYFDEMSLSEVVEHLRGEVGSQIRLFVQRFPEDGRLSPVSFEVPVTRSMIVVQPPLLD